MALPASYDITMYQGDTFSLQFRIRNVNADQSLGNYIDLTGQTPLSQIRLSAASTSVIATFVSTLGNQSTTPGLVTISLDHTTTAAIQAPKVYVWDFQMTDGSGVVTTYLAGNVNVVAEVTH